MSPQRGWVVAALAGAALVVVVLLGREAAAWLPGFAAWVRELGPWGPVAFVAGYTIAPTLLIPGSVLTVAAGALFGLPLGVAYVMLGATLGSSLAFLSGRYVARQFVEHLLERHPRLVAIDRAVEREGFRLVLLLRLSPVVPFTLLNYALGLSRVRFADYALASIGMLPVTSVYVYAGKVAGDLAAVASGVAAPRDAAYYAVLGLGLAATIAVTVVLTRLARRAMAKVDELTSGDGHDDLR
ncbi:MAG: TVP38/TMEM64 family protein [Acidobacteriota bacterium]